MPKAPLNTTDPSSLADWLELNAVCAEAHSSSSTDLASLLRIATTPDDSEEQLLQDTFAELEARSIAAKCGYPFNRDGAVLRLKAADWREYAPYLFCLLLSARGVKFVTSPNPTRLFERLAGAAAQRLLGGKSHNFGFPRSQGLPSGFKEAVEALCKSTQEGDGLDPTAKVYDEKDDALDVVAWRPFPDKWPGQLMLFGQCAAGNDWISKRSELDPGAFSNKWFRKSPQSPVIKAFFIPHRVERDRWRNLCYDAGLILERCRLAYWARGAGKYEDHIEWLKAAIKKLNQESTTKKKPKAKKKSKAGGKLKN
jgi:hypothetical protein